MRAYMSAIGNPWRIFDGLLNEFPYELFNSVWRAHTGKFPRVNVWESDDGVVLEAEVAGVDPADLEVAVDANVLTIKGERDQGDETSKEFQRSFNLPFELEREQIKATVRNGILSLVIPRKEAEKRVIKIEKL